jgi:hypothetical protein
MAPDERERNFDKALGRHLRSTAPADRAALPPAGSPSRRGSCPDTETLAAYHERSLLSGEMNSWKEHIVGCAYCQTILTQLEATDQIALQASAQPEALGAKESEPVMTARSLEPLPAAAAPKRSRRVLLLRGARWQWLVPAGAMAAGLLVWVALHENQRLPLPRAQEVQIAKQIPSPPMPSTSTGSPVTSPARSAIPTKPQSAGDEVTAPKTLARSEALKPSGKLDYQDRASPSQPLAEKESGLRKDAERPSAGDLRGVEEQAGRDAKAASRERQENAEVQLQAQNQAANAQSLNQLNSNAAKVSGPAPMGQSQVETKKMKAATAAPAAPPPSQPAAIAGNLSTTYDSSAALEVASVITNPHLISPPGSRLLWRAGRAGVIEFSRDSGTSWSRQRSGVRVDLQTGSAPSENVCWIVGRVGSVLLTTDGGAHWKLLSFPLADDLGGVRATDALHATIWNLHNTKSFETTDGGLTWKRVLNP